MAQAVFACSIAVLVLTNVSALVWAVRASRRADRWQVAAQRSAEAAKAWRDRLFATAPRQPARTVQLPALAAVDPEEFRRTAVRRVR